MFTSVALLVCLSATQDEVKSARRVFENDNAALTVLWVMYKESPGGRFTADEQKALGKMFFDAGTAVISEFVNVGRARKNLGKARIYLARAAADSKTVNSYRDSIESKLCNH